MSNVLTLFTYPNNINYVTVSEGKDGTLKEGDFTLRDGTEIKIFISEDEDGKSWVITGGFSFFEYQNEVDFIKAFIELQKGKIDLYE